MKRICVLIDRRHEEGLRMALGLTLAGDEISVFVAGRALEGEMEDEYVSLLQDMGASVFHDDSGLPDIINKTDNSDMVKAVYGSDHVLRY